MTSLGEHIKNLRLEKKWTQSDAAKKCGEVSQSVLSRIESGEISVPTADTLQKLANGFSVSYDSLSELAAANVPSGVSELRVGFAHSLWAAPVIPLAMEGPTPTGIKLTSYGLSTASEFEYEPEWYGSKQKSKLRVGPRFGSAPTAEDRLPPGYELWPGDAQLTTYSAADLDRLLKWGYIDCVVAAKNVFDSRDKLLIRCARIMDCVGAGAALLVWNSNWEWAADFAVAETSVLDLFQPLEEAAKGKNQMLCTFFPEGTSAEKSLKFLPEEWAKKNLNPKSLSLRRWQSVTDALQTALREEHAFLFLCWEPFLSYARALFGSAQSVVAVHLSDRKPLPYLSFDLFFTREKARDWFESTNVRHFLSRLAYNIDEIKDAITLQDEKTRVVSQIAAYLGMSSSDCLRSLSEMDFGLFYYPDWLDRR